MSYLVGNWDDALTLADEEIAGDHHYQQHVALGIRAAIRMARGDAEGALSDANTSLRDARAIRDPQALHPALVTGAEVAYRTGDSVAAIRLLDELGTPERKAGSWVVRAALLSHDLGREPAFASDDAVRTVWGDAAFAIARGELAQAADLLESTGARTFEAAAHLRAVTKQVSKGRRPTDEAQLARALAFYREVGASAYVREAEALLPAAS